MLSATVVANNILERAFKEKIEVSPMKLQKLLYFVFKKHLQNTDQLLFTESFEAWQFGPVIPSVYQEFKSYGNKAIKQYGKDAKGKSIKIKEDSISSDAFDFVWEKYKYLSAIRLSELTHGEETAWQKAIDSNSYILDYEEIKNEQWK